MWSLIDNSLELCKKKNIIDCINVCILQAPWFYTVHSWYITKCGTIYNLYEYKCKIKEIKKCSSYPKIALLNWSLIIITYYTVTVLIYSISHFSWLLKTNKPAGHCTAKMLSPYELYSTTNSLYSLLHLYKGHH